MRSFNLKGNLIKFWDGDILIKGSSYLCNEPISEYLASSIFERFSNVPTIRYYVESNFMYPEIKSDLISKCKKFKYKLINFGDYVEDRHFIEDQFSYLEIYKQYNLPMDFYLRVLIMDALIGNQDRHWNNFDIYQDENCKMRIGPALDFGRSLLFNINSPDEFISNKYLDFSCNIDSTHEYQLDYIKSNYNCTNLVNFDKDSLLNLTKLNISNISDFIEEWKAKAIIEFLSERYDKYIKPLIK